MHLSVSAYTCLLSRVCQFVAPQAALMQAITLFTIRNLCTTASASTLAEHHIAAGAQCPAGNAGSWRVCSAGLGDWQGTHPKRNRPPERPLRPEQ